MIERVDRALRRRITHCDGGIESETAGEHRRTGEYVLFTFAEKIETPVDRGAQRLMTVSGRAGPPSEESEAIVEKPSYLDYR